MFNCVFLLVVCLWGGGGCACDSGHWMVESLHWYLDVTFHEDADRTVDKVVVCNLNILRKLVLNILWLVDVGKKNVGMRKKRNMIGWNLPKYLEQILTI